MTNVAGIAVGGASLHSACIDSRNINLPGGGLGRPPGIFVGGAAPITLFDYDEEMAGLAMPKPLKTSSIL